MDGLSPMTYDEVIAAHTDVYMNGNLKLAKVRGLFKYVNAQLTKGMSSPVVKVAINVPSMFKACGGAFFTYKQTTFDVLRAAYGDTFDVTFRELDDADVLVSGSTNTCLYIFSKKATVSQ